MATTVPVKREMLKSIGNVPDWVLKQRVTKDKKDASTTKPIRRSAPKPKAATTQPPVRTAPKPTVNPQPIIEEVKDPIENGVQSPPAGSKVRRIYSREFLIKFKYSASPFPTGAITPQDIIAQYNKDFEQKERLAHENSGKPAHVSTIPSATTVTTTQAEQQGTASTEVPRVATTTEKRIKKIKTEGGEKKTFKLKGFGATDESILRSPLFRASATNKVQAAGTKRSLSPFTPVDDKENPMTLPSKVIRSTSAKRRSESPLVTTTKEAPKTQKLPTTSSSIVPPTPAALPTTIPTPAPIYIKTEITPVPIPAPEAEKKEQGEINAEDARQAEVVDILTKKLKAVLKETDPRRLAQRQKQIEYGKATAGYKDYAKLIAKSKRKREDPKTPNKYQVCSKRSWDGQIRKWRRMLHFYDPADLQDSKDPNAQSAEGDEDAKVPQSFEVTEADILREQNALLE